MKKTFPLTHPKKKPERLVDAIRSEVNKYLKRERKKTLPDGTDYWDFDCKVGVDAESAFEASTSAHFRKPSAIRSKRAAKPAISKFCRNPASA